MWTDDDIRRMLAGLAAEYGPPPTLVARVKDVNRNDSTCTLIDDETEYYNVRLAPVTGTNKGYVQIPKAGSIVLAVKVEDSDEWAVIACTEIEQIQVIVNDESLAEWAKDFITAIRNMKFTTNVGPTITLINDPDFIALENRLNKILY